MSSLPKVFCIGWHKTGTSSLGAALIELGYSVVGARLDLENSLRDGHTSTALTLAGQYDAAQDIPWALLFRELDEAYPGSRFIFTNRNDDTWIRSATSHFGDRDISMHEWLYGDGRCLGNERLYLERFRRHRCEVREWFSSRNSDLLEMDFERGDGWEELCRFLGHSVPRRPWPHTNRGKHSRGKIDKVRDKTRQLVPMAIRKVLFSIRLYFRGLLGMPDPRNRFNNFRENRSTQSHSRDQKKY